MQLYNRQTLYSLISRRWKSSSANVALGPLLQQPFSLSHTSITGSASSGQVTLPSQYRQIKTCLFISAILTAEVQPPYSRYVERYPMTSDGDIFWKGSLSIKLVVQTVGSQRREMLTKIDTQRRSSQLYASPQSALNLKPCVLIYDGVCHLCNAGVKWIIKVDKKKHISFCALQSRSAEPYLLLCGLTREDVVQRFVFVEGPGAYHQASTALKVATYLPFPYSALSIFTIVPAPLRDAVYDFVARRRYNWFGKASECIIPTDSVLDRFVDKFEIQEKMAGEQSDGDDR